MRYLSIVILLSLSSWDHGDATTLSRFDLQALTDNAEKIFHGNCVETGSSVLDGIPYTVYRFSVNEMVKGGEQKEITVQLLGGELEGKRFDLVGMPTFSEGEEVVLFLTEVDGRNNAWPVGLSQGKFRVARVGAAKTAFIEQATGDAVIYDTGAAKGAAGEFRPQTLAAFLQRVRGHVQTSGDGDAANGPR